MPAGREHRVDGRAGGGEAHDEDADHDGSQTLLDIVVLLVVLCEPELPVEGEDGDEQREGGKELRARILKVKSAVWSKRAV